MIWEKKSQKIMHLLEQKQVEEKLTISAHAVRAYITNGDAKNRARTVQGVKT